MDGSGIYLASRSAGSGDDISVGEMRLLVTAAISFDAHAIIQAILKVQKLKQALEDQFTNAKPSTSGSQFMNPSEREIVAYMEDNPDTGNPFNSPEGSSQFKQQPQSSSNVRVEPAYQIPIETQAHKDGGFNAQAVFMRDYSPPPRIAADPNRIFSDCGPTSSTMSDPLLNPSDIKSSIASLHSSGYYSMSDPLLGEGLPPIFTYPSKVKVKRKRKWQIPQKSFTRPILPAHTTEGASLKVGESSTRESPISESPKAKEKTPPIGEISNRPRLSPNTQRLVDKSRREISSNQASTTTLLNDYHDLMLMDPMAPLSSTNQLSLQRTAITSLAHCSKSERKFCPRKPPPTSVHKLYRIHCKRCSARFKTKPEYQAHLRSQVCAGSSGTHTCTVCGYCTLERQRLTLHMRTHSGERPHKCPLCSYAASQMGPLKRHLMSIHMKTGGISLNS